MNFLRRVMLASLVACVGIMFNAGCKSSTSPSSGDAPEVSMRQALTFYASFDDQVDADFALGDPQLYTAPSWDKRYEGQPGTPGSGIVNLAENEGRYGGALQLDTDAEPIIYFKANNNVDYRKADWSGTISFWLKLDPDKDLRPGYCDPIQITASSWNDACFFVDFTERSPRIFRAAAFADLGVWKTPRPEVEVPQPPFGRDQWTHVVMTFSRFNTGAREGVLKLYLNGAYTGAVTDREQTFTWEPEKALIRIGYRYVGLFDELAFFSRALDESEVRTLHLMNGSIHDLLD